MQSALDTRIPAASLSSPRPIPAKVRPQDTRTGRWLQVRFEDDGGGIPPEALPFIFDPFYTTKGAGKGTGLGLSVSFMIVQGSGGMLEAERTTAEGTTMTIRLPLIATHLPVAPVPFAARGHFVPGPDVPGTAALEIAP